MSQMSAQDLSWFWTTWFYEPWPLDQAIASVQPDGDSTAITIEDRGLAPMPVRLAITRTGGQVQRLELPVTGWLTGARRQIVHVASSPAVVKVEIDPDGSLPRHEPRESVVAGEAVALAMRVQAMLAV